MVTFINGTRPAILSSNSWLPSVVASNFSRLLNSETTCTRATFTFQSFYVQKAPEKELGCINRLYCNIHLQYIGNVFLLTEDIKVPSYVASDEQVSEQLSVQFYNLFRGWIESIFVNL